MAANTTPPFDCFEDFDQASVYKNYQAALLRPETHNIVIDFDNATSFAALNLDSVSLKKVLQTEVRPALQNHPLLHKL
jgi:hypothetical protein